MNGRTAAFLKEMGITPLWVPRTAAPQAEAEQQPAVAPAAPAPAPVQAPQRDAAVPAELSEEQRIARMDWAELEQAIAACTRCGACAPGTRPVMGAGARRARWVVAAGAASAQDHKEGVPLAGEAGTLLANMLAAAGHSADNDVWVTNVIKCRPSTSSGADRAPTAEEAAACRPFVEREVALTGADTLLTLGQVAANAMLGQPLSQPLAQARGQQHQAAGVRMVATLHPAELLRRGQDKSLAWTDLCLAATDGPPA
ncbi:uracil-DNA glycosylase [Pseudoduganella sp. GCM10020061]|uniref:uracil-DNA glycosylase n=1 Tax=Pseudoduganella sp. GCM10020061 TaxID=3317345 RepID=UPI0036417F43